MIIIKGENIMQTYCPDQRKRKNALKIIVRINIKQSKGFVKFCYGATWFLRVLAVILGIANILYVIFLSDYMVDILFLIITFGFPYGFSYLPATVYIISASGEYRFRKKETITLKDDEILYSYHDDRVGLSDSIFAFHIVPDKINKCDYDEKTNVLTLYGRIVGETYENGELKESDEYNQISLLDVYDISVKNLINQ